MNTYGLIMAGGRGTRFWPLSRKSNPKQFLRLSGKDALINETIKRSRGIIDKDNIFIVADEKQEKNLKKILGTNCIEENILLEPVTRNTAACIGYSAINIVKKHGDGVMCVFPSDHYIEDEKAFNKVIRNAVALAEEHDKLVTIGIKPSFPSTGYGYIKLKENEGFKIGRESAGEVAFKVDNFIEKPDYKKAIRYYDSGKYLWNSGIFIWKISTILNNFKRFLPKVWNGLEELAKYIGLEGEGEHIRKIYPDIPAVSIDYGIMERSDDLIVIPGDFAWNDVGSWDSLAAIYSTDNNGNIIRGEKISIDTKNSIIYGGKRLIATIGLDKMIVVETDDSILVCPKDRAQDVKRVVELLRAEGKDKYL
jgi:mannose-1-phosphate guanylyltransferase